MLSKCRVCGKTLGFTCDYCQSHNVRASSNHPNTMDCNHCHRSAMPLGRSEPTTCYGCERLKASKNQALEDAT